MSYIRFGEDRRYFEGQSNLYAYPRNGGGNSLIKSGVTSDEDLGELALRIVERSDVSDEVLEEVVSAVIDEYESTEESEE